MGSARLRDAFLATTVGLLHVDMEQAGFLAAMDGCTARPAPPAPRRPAAVTAMPAADVAGNPVIAH